MTYTHPYLSTPYTLCVDIEPRGTQHSSFHLPVAGVCTLVTPSPLPCVPPPPRGSSLNWSRVAEWRPGARSRRGDFATKRRHRGQHQGRHGGLIRGTIALALCSVIDCLLSFKWQSSYYILWNTWTKLSWVWGENIILTWYLPDLAGCYYVEKSFRNTSVAGKLFPG